MKRSPSENVPGREGEAPLWVVSMAGRSRFRPVWDLQQRLWKARHRGLVPDTLLLLEHTPVVTLGRNAQRANLLLDSEGYRSRGLEVVEIDRGGDVTYHGPGQLIGYWVVDLRELYLDVHRYLRDIEEVLIRTLGRFGIEAERSPGATGVWIGDEKVAAIGMHLSRWVSTHGFALNVDADLEPFRWIVPCGLPDRGVTSMEKQIAAAGGEPRKPARPAVERAVVEAADVVFGRRPLWRAPAQLEADLEAAETKMSSTESERNGACLV